MPVQEDIIALVVLITIFLIYYTKARKQTLKETIEEIKEGLAGEEENE